MFLANLKGVAEMVDKPFLYPNVTSVPGSKIESSNPGPKKQEGVKSDFDRVFDETLVKSGKPGAEKISKEIGDVDGKLEAVKQPLKFSAHASQRLQERKISIDPETMIKVNDAIDKAQAKGVEDTLILTNNAALIVNVPNRTVITAMDKGSLNGNVFTNIDGAVII